MPSDEKKVRPPLLPPTVRNTPALVEAILTPRAILMWLNSTDQARTFDPINRNFNMVSRYLDERNVEFPQVESGEIRWAGPHGETLSMPAPGLVSELLAHFKVLGERYEAITISQALAALVVCEPKCADPVHNPEEMRIAV